MQKKLPTFGIGPVYGGIVIALTAAAVLCRNLQIFAFGRVAALHVPMAVLGLLLIALGVFMWVHANFISRIDDGINSCRLVTTGIYAWVRNPIYSAIMSACTGVILLLGNLCFLILPFFFWLLMTVLLRSTEEKLLKTVFGKEYEDYCSRVNRCIPWKHRESK